MDLKQKMTLKQPQNAIYCDSDAGPIFGGGFDIHISDKCHINKESYANFPSSYNFVPKPYAVDNQASWNAFSGATSG